MSLTELTHTFRQSAAPSTNDMEGWLDAIFDALNGAMTHWDVSKFETGGGVTEAVYFTPKAGTAADDANIRIILAGTDSGSPTPPLMEDVSSWTNGVLHAGIVVNGGNFNAWDDTNPFTSGSFSGYGPGGQDSSINVQVFDIVETAETIIFLAEDADDDDIFALATAGAIIDPESTNTQNVGTNAGAHSASEQRPIYGILTCGVNRNMSSLYLFGSTNVWGAHDNTSTDPKFVYLAPDDTWDTAFLAPELGSSQNDLIQEDGSPLFMQVFAMDLVARKIIGRLREMFLGPICVHRQIYNDSGGDPAFRAISGDSSGLNVSLCCKL